MTQQTDPYSVKMVDSASLTLSERSAAELRFRMALESSVGGRDYVVPTLQACMLARALLAQVTAQEAAGPEHAAEREVIALWENAEDKAVLNALKPLNRDMGDARFEINA